MYYPVFEVLCTFCGAFHFYIQGVVKYLESAAYIGGMRTNFEAFRQMHEQSGNTRIETL